jgi:hypothetical protein
LHGIGAGPNLPKIGAAIDYGGIMTEKSKDEALKGLDESKRRTLIRLGLGAAFVTPIVASFSMEGLTISKVHAQSRDGSGVTHPRNQTE